MRACRDALRLISRRPTRSPLLKFPLPCLNSHKVESGDPVWKTSLTMSKVDGLETLENTGLTGTLVKYLYGTRTCSTDEQMMRYWYV